MTAASLCNACGVDVGILPKGRSTLRCGECKNILYCSLQCQEADWQKQKEKCEVTRTSDRAGSVAKAGDIDLASDNLRLERMSTEEILQHARSSGVSEKLIRTTLIGLLQNQSVNPAVLSNSSPSHSSQHACTTSPGSGSARGPDFFFAGIDECGLLSTVVSFIPADLLDFCCLSKGWHERWRRPDIWTSVMITEQSKRHVSRNAIRQFLQWLPSKLQHLKLNAECWFEPRYPERECRVDDFFFFIEHLPRTIISLDLNVSPDMFNCGMCRYTHNTCVFPPGLESLDLHHLTFCDGYVGMKILLQGLPKSLRTFKLCLDSSECGPRGAQIIASCLPQGLHELVLCLANCSLDYQGACVLAPRLPQTLTKLHLNLDCGIGISEAGVTLLAAHVPRALNDLCLDLSCTEIGDRGMRSLAQALPTTLRRLVLLFHFANLQDGGICHLAKQFPPLLTELVLSFDGEEGISMIGATAIVNSLPESLNVFNLSCRNCRFLFDSDAEVIQSLVPSRIQHFVTFTDAHQSFTSWFLYDQWSWLEP